jgi:hypothetical protein
MPPAGADMKIEEASVIPNAVHLCGLIPLTSSQGSGAQPFFSAGWDLSQYCDAKFGWFLSGASDSLKPITVVGTIMVNGEAFAGSRGQTADPLSYVGQAPSKCFLPVDPIELDPAKSVRSQLTLHYMIDGPFYGADPVSLVIVTKPAIGI